MQDVQVEAVDLNGPTGQASPEFSEVRVESVEGTPQPVVVGFRRGDVQNLGQDGFGQPGFDLVEGLWSQDAIETSILRRGSIANVLTPKRLFYVENRLRWASSPASGSALRALSANKLRAALTMLGVIIGVGAVITMVSVGKGAQLAITAQIQSLGTNLLFIRPGAQQQLGVASQQGTRPTLTYEDAVAEAADLPVAAVAPEEATFGQIPAKGGSGFGNQDDQVYVPITTLTMTVVLGSKGHILRNNHVVSGARRLEVTLAAWPDQAQ